MSKPFCPPNPIDLPIAPCTTPWPACARNCTPSSTANALLRERREELVEEPAEALERFLEPVRRRSAARRPSADRDRHHRPALRRRQRPAPDREHADAREHQHHDRHAGDQAHPVDRRAHAEPARRRASPARSGGARGARSPAGCAAGSRTRRDGRSSPRPWRRRRPARPRPRRPGGVHRPSAGQHVDVGTDLDALPASSACRAAPSRPAFVARRRVVSGHTCRCTALS